MQIFIRSTGILLVSLFMLTGWKSHAGYVEIGASTNYKFSGFDENNSVETIAYSASYAYYFLEQCAVEVSYTSGYSKQVSQADANNPRYISQNNIDLIAMDLILSFGTREDLLQPYIKAGGGYLKKELFFKVDQGPNLKTSESEGFVPSAGIGIKIGITKTVSVKIGADAWTSPLNKKDKVIVDYVGRAGLTWMF